MLFERVVCGGGDVVTATNVFEFAQYGTLYYTHTNVEIGGFNNTVKIAQLMYCLLLRTRLVTSNIGNCTLGVKNQSIGLWFPREVWLNF